MRDLCVEIQLKFDFLHGVGKYEAFGYLFDNIVPLFGKGTAE